MPGIWTHVVLVNNVSEGFRGQSLVAAIVFWVERYQQWSFKISIINFEEMNDGVLERLN